MEKDIKNRIIKFRGKCLDNWEWVYGYFYEECENTYIIEDRQRSMNDILARNIPYKVNPDTIGQFTGLLDKNGKEIYEDDILKHGRDGRLYVVKFFDGMFYASVEECNKNIYGGFPLHVLTNEEDKYKCEIVGNVHNKC